MASGEGQIHHCVGIRLRVTGNADLKPSLLNDDATVVSNLIPIEVTSAPGREMDRRANFKSQSMQLRLITTGINEHFLISKIILFSKVSANSYPS